MPGFCFVSASVLPFSFFLPSLLPSCLPLLGSLPRPPVPSHSCFCASGNNTLQDDIFHHHLKACEWLAPVFSVSMSALEALLPLSSVREGPRPLSDTDALWGWFRRTGGGGGSGHVTGSADHTHQVGVVTRVGLGRQAMPSKWEF